LSVAVPLFHTQKVKRERERRDNHHRLRRGLKQKTTIRRAAVRTRSAKNRSSLRHSLSFVRRRMEKEGGKENVREPEQRKSREAKAYGKEWNREENSSHSKEVRKKREGQVNHHPIMVMKVLQENPDCLYWGGRRPSSRNEEGRRVQI